MLHSGPDLDASTAYAQLCRPEAATAATVTRRRLLQGIVALGAGATLSAAVPSWAREALAATPAARNERVLVLLTMNGGNDSLNMVVPYGSAEYYSRRPTVAIAPDRVLTLDGRVGLHPELRHLHSLYQEGKVAIVEGVGTNRPDLSHFVSMGNWMRGWGGENRPTTGWIGRWLDAVSAPPLHAVHLGSSVPLQMSGATRKASALSLNAPFGAQTDPYWGRLYNTISRFAARPTGLGPWGDAIASNQRDQLVVASAVRGLYDRPLGSAPLVPALALAARLINADLGTRVVSVEWGDFDSHNGHRALHDARMAELDAGIQAFWAALGPQWENRVTLMAYSEFGRRLPQNGNDGIDHGTAGTVLLVGPKVRGGLHGAAPSLTALAENAFPVATTHYLELYASVLDQWLDVDPAAILGTNPTQLDRLFTAAGGTTTTTPPPEPANPGGLTAITPVRRLDTRTGLGVTSAGKLGPQQSINLRVAGIGAVVPKAMAVVMNVTAIASTRAGYVTVWPTGDPRPPTSNLNFDPGSVVPNLVLAKIGERGMVSFFNAGGEVDLAADVVGYLAAESSSKVTPLSPTRLVDTRTSSPIGPDSELVLTIAGGPIPRSGVRSVILNVTVTGASAPSYLAVYPDGIPRPYTSNVNYGAGQTVPNLVVTRLGRGGRIRCYNAAGVAHVIVDLLGYVSDTNVGKGRVVAISPARVYDSRIPGRGGPLAGGEERPISLAGLGGLPEGPFSGVVANVTITEPTDGGYATVWPTGTRRPVASNLNFAPGQSVANLVLSAVGDDRAVNLFVPRGQAHVIVDVVGYVD